MLIFKSKKKTSKIKLCVQKPVILKWRAYKEIKVFIAIDNQKCNKWKFTTSVILCCNYLFFVASVTTFNQTCNQCPANAKCNNIEVCQCKDGFAESVDGDCFGKYMDLSYTITDETGFEMLYICFYLSKYSFTNCAYHKSRISNSLLTDFFIYCIAFNINKNK